MRPFGFLSRLIGLGTLVLAAQSLAAATLTGYKHTGWTEEDGAPAFVRSLAQSRDGFLWLAAGAAVYRFDGVSFAKMPTLTDAELGDLQPQSVHASPNGDVWIGYRPGAVGLYRHGVLRDLHMPNPPGFVTAIADDGSGGIWTTSDHGRGGLMHFGGGRWTGYGPAQGVPAGEVHQVAVFRDGTIWAVEYSALLFRRRGADRFETAPATITPGAAVAQGPDGRMWLADMNGIRPLPDYPHGATGSPAPEASEPGGALRRIAFDRAGNLWGTDSTHGLFRIAAAALGSPAGRAHPDVFTAADGLTSNRVRSPLFDREGNLWLGTENGVDRLRPAAVRPQPGIPPNSSAYAAATDSNGIIYIEDDVGVYAIAPRRPARLLSTVAGSISPPCRIADGTVMVATPTGLLHLTTDRMVSALGLSEVPSACVEDAHGRLWFLSATTGLTWRDAGGWHVLTAPPEAKSAIDLIPGPHGVAVANIVSRSLLWLDPARPVSLTAARVGVGAIVSAYSGESGLLIGGSRGLARLRDGAIRALSGDRYPWLVRPRAMLQTTRGDTWLLVPAGLVRVASRDLDRAFDAGGPLTYQLFDAADGLTGRMQKNGLLGSQILEGADGVVRVLTSAGVAAIDPATLTRNLLPPPVTIASLTAGGTTYLDPVAVKLRAGASNLDIVYAALSLSVPGRVRFRYRLEGVDDGWVDPGSRREAVYGNVAPGTYRFHVIAANDDGVWNTAGATLRIDIPPTFIQSIWFKLLLAVAFIAALWWAYALRLRVVTDRLNATMGIRLGERERIARELHDTLLQTFQGLVLQFQAAANRIPAGGTARPAIDQALRRADVALAEGRDRVRDLRVHAADGDLARGWTATAAELNLDRPVRFELVVEGRPRALHPMVHEELQRLGEEALRNAFRHARATTIDATLTYRADRLRLVIRDDGVGLPPEVAATGERPGHYGLTGMRERARRIGGRLTIASRAGAGTEISFSVAGKVAYRVAARHWWVPTVFAGAREAA